jgi:hypothetical protein
MSHCNPVTDPNHSKLEWNPATGCNSLTHFIGEVSEMGVAGDDIIPGICNPNKWEIHLSVAQAEGSEKRTIWSPWISFF